MPPWSDTDVNRFDSAGNLTHEPTKQNIRELVQSFGGLDTTDFASVRSATLNAAILFEPS
jgi:hypothetical protein